MHFKAVASSGCPFHRQSFTDPLKSERYGLIAELLPDFFAELVTWIEENPNHLGKFESDKFVVCAAEEIEENLKSAKSWDTAVSYLTARISDTIVHLLDSWQARQQESCNPKYLRVMELATGSEIYKNLDSPDRVFSAGLGTALSFFRSALSALPEILLRSEEKNLALLLSPDKFNAAVDSMQKLMYSAAGMHIQEHLTLMQNLRLDSNRLRAAIFELDSKGNIMFRSEILKDVSEHSELESPKIGCPAMKSNPNSVKVLYGILAVAAKQHLSNHFERLGKKAAMGSL